MKRFLAAFAAAAAMAASACSPGPADDAAPAEAAAADAAATAPVPSARDEVAGSPAAAAPPAATGAPSYAVVYPGGVPEGPPTLADSPTGPGGVLTFNTEAAPEAVVTFYKERAEAAGLRPINSMNQGEARAYSAGDGADGRGQLLSVVAAPDGDGRTSVQLTWTNGR